jgi:hypothetical protein
VAHITPLFTAVKKEDTKPESARTQIPTATKAKSITNLVDTSDDDDDSEDSVIVGKRAAPNPSRSRRSGVSLSRRRNPKETVPVQSSLLLRKPSRSRSSSIPLATKTTEEIVVLLANVPLRKPRRSPTLLTTIATRKKLGLE